MPTKRTPLPDELKALIHLIRCGHLLGGSALIALDGERTIGMGTKPDGSVLIYAGLKAHDDTARQSLEEASSPAQRVAWFHANFEGWSELWAPLFREAVSMVWR